jgi:hypothetical protein
LILLAFSCTKKEMPEDSSTEDLKYYPLTQGKFVIYDVDSVVYTEIPKDTVIYKYRIKEKIADSFTDNTGQPAIRLERFIKKYDPKKSYDSISWTLKEVWMVNADRLKVQVVENNIRYTKLIFPIIEKASWNGNANNTLGAQNYVYDYIDRQESINGNNLEKVLFVRQRKDSSAISFRRFSEKYASGVGLVFREMTELYSNNVVPGKPVEARIENGLAYKQNLVSFGHE